MKTITLILILCSFALAQKLDADAKVYLIDKDRAHAIYKGDNLAFGDLQPYQEGDDTKGKVALVLKSRNREALLDAIEMTGIVGGRRVVIADCLQGVHRGEECTVHRQRQ